MKYNKIYNYGSKLKKINFNRTFSLDFGKKEQYYNRFIKKENFWNLNLDNDFNSGKYAKSFEMYDDQITRNFVTSFRLFESLKKATHLPPAEKSKEKKLGELFEKRISERKFTTSKWSLQDIGNLCSGIRMSSNYHRPYASGGGIYPIDVYFLTQNIKGLNNSSVYKYQPCTNSVLEIGKMQDINFSSYVHIENFINPKNIKLMLYLVANRAKNEFKYGNRALIFSLIESGEMIQNIALCASQYDYKMCQLGGYDIEKSNAILKIDGFNNFITTCAVLGS